MPPLHVLSMPAPALVLPRLIPLVLTACALVGCGGSAPPPDDVPRGGESGFKSSKSGRREPEAPSFMRVGPLLPASELPAGAATAAPSVMVATPPPPPPPPPGGDPSGRRPLPTAATRELDKDSSAERQGSTPPHENKRPEAAVVDSAGGLSEAEVRATIVQKQSSFRECYNLGRAGAGAFQGTITLRVSIGPSGAVSAVEVVSSTTKNLRVDSCVSDAVHRIQFSAKGGGAVIAFPIEFGG